MISTQLLFGPENKAMDAIEYYFHVFAYRFRCEVCLRVEDEKFLQALVYWA